MSLRHYSNDVITMATTSSANVSTYYKKIFFGAIETIIEDPTFNTDSIPAARALETAKKLREWCRADPRGTDELDSAESATGKFIAELVRDINCAISSLVSESGRVSRDKLWVNYFKIRSSAAFVTRWTVFLQQAGAVATPIFFQHVTDILFRRILKEQHVVPESSLSAVKDITPQEANVLRYAAGYVVRRTLKKVSGKDEEAYDCLQQLLKVEGDEFENGTAEEWTNLVDRGGLLHIRETTFQVFLALEDGVRRFLAADLSGHGMRREKVIDFVLENEDVAFSWSVASAAFDNEDEKVHKNLLRMLAKLFITMRGHAYASGWIEQYKQAQKKSTQRSKGLRKTIYTDENS